MAEGAAPAAAETATAAVHEGWSLAGEGAADAVEAIKAEESEKAEPGDVSKAASELGRKGGKAAAEARAKAAKEAPAPAAKDAKAPAEPAEADDDAEDEGQDAKRSRARQRVEEATRKAAEERRERERVARERDELRAELERERRARQAPQPEPRRQAEPENDGPPEPKPEDFEDYNQYQQALIDHHVEKKLAARQRETEARQRATELAKTIAAKEEEFRARLGEAGGPDFLAEISEDVKALRPSHKLAKDELVTSRNIIADFLVFSDQTPALMRYLSDNPREFQRIAELGPYRIAYEMGRLANQFEARGGATAGSSPSSGSPASKPAKSQAPPPVRPVTGAPSAVMGDYFREGEDFDSWNRRQRAAGR